MRVAREILAALPLTVLASATALGASIVGTVTGPDGKPFMGAFVAAENPQTPDDGERALGRAGALSHRRSAGRDLHGSHRGDRLCERAARQRRACRRRDGVARLCAAKDARALERPVDVSGASAPAQGGEPRPHLQGRVLHHLLPVLPFVPEADGDPRVRSRRLARARALHERRDARRPQAERHDGRGLRVLSRHDVRQGLAEARLAGRAAAIQGAGAAGERGGDEHRLCRIRLCGRGRHGPVERGRGQGREVLDSLLRARQQGGAARSEYRRADAVPAAPLRPRRSRHPFGHSGSRRHGLVHRGRTGPHRPARSDAPER